MLCPEGTNYRENVHTPRIRSRRCFRVFHVTTLNCIEYLLQESYLGWIMCHFFVETSYFLYYTDYVYIVYIDVSNVH